MCRGETAPILARARDPTRPRLTPMESSPRSSAAATQTPERASVWEDFLDIFYAPRSVFARRENESFWIPLVVVTLLLGTLFIVNAGVTEPIMTAEMDRGLAQAARDNPDVTPEMREQMRGQMRSFGRTMATVGAFLGGPFIIFALAIATWLVGKAVGARQAWHAALVVAAYSYVPRVLEAVLTGVQGLLVDPAQLDGRYRLSLGPGRVLDPDTASPVLVALLGRLDVFTIWVTVLLAIGLAVTGRIDRGRAAIAGVLLWIVGALPGVIGALRAS